MKYDIPAALQALRPGAQWVLRGSEMSGLEWLDTEQTVPSEADINAKISDMVILLSKSKTTRKDPVRIKRRPSMPETRNSGGFRGRIGRRRVAPRSVPIG